ncbi:CDP-alcohol phosphatidyltransferase-domain-containing protein [Vararia minispora EC-137]|uniref:CDP-alcohol phosphatidyltransferase-domain-containing protein n=1 Tax=Vararia minispora EC-137 TaxID=1314806 RepID=A0ACB8QXG0_9AGAM|nr:CDP-alcohol phosphatidyltransferase-domain-containing protein [Vararia minispora EC-137]
MRFLLHLHRARPHLLCVENYRYTAVSLSRCSLSYRRNYTLPQPSPPPKPSQTLRENIYTFPNLLTLSRIASCPVLGWAVIGGHHKLATGILVYAGISDWVDGYLARRYSMKSVLGTILDPAADKALVTTLTVTLGLKGLIPVPLMVVIIGRDVLLSLSAFYIRYTSLPPPKTFKRYWDFGIPSAEVRPTYISKVNTALQLFLMGVTTISPLLPAAAIHVGGLALDMSTFLTGLQYTVGTTTIWSGLSYALLKEGGYVISRREEGKSDSGGS